MEQEEERRRHERARVLIDDQKRRDSFAKQTMLQEREAETERAMSVAAEAAQRRHAEYQRLSEGEYER